MVFNTAGRSMHVRAIHCSTKHSNLRDEFSLFVLEVVRIKFSVYSRLDDIISLPLHTPNCKNKTQQYSRIFEDMITAYNRDNFTT